MKTEMRPEKSGSAEVYGTRRRGRKRMKETVERMFP